MARRAMEQWVTRTSIWTNRRVSSFLRGGFRNYHSLEAMLHDGYVFHEMQLHM